MTDPISLPPEPTLRLPTLDEVRTRSAQRRRRRTLVRGAAAGGALAAAVLLTLGFLPGTTGMQTRGAEVLPHLEARAAVVGQAGTRALEGEASLADQLVFRIIVDQPGTLSIVELRNGAVQPVLEQTIPAGTFVPGGDPPLGWRTEAGPGPARYVVEHCIDEGRCSRRDLEVRWVE